MGRHGRLHHLAVSVLAGLSLALGACGGDSNSGGDPGSGPPGDGTPPDTERPTVTLRVLSSAPDQVTGGDARIAIDGAGKLGNMISLWLNNEPIGTDGLKLTGERLEGVITGLKVGANRLEVHHKAHGKLAAEELVNYPITGPIFSGPQQQPFVCTTVQELGVQPLVDTSDPPGWPVYDDEDNVIGYSRDCSIEPYVEYVYRSTDGSYKALPENGSKPADLATTRLSDGREVDFVVRWERGTINRFIYSIAMLAPFGENPDAPSLDRWNGRLAYHFQGGVGIGHSQGELDYNRRALRPDVLGQGYAIAYSTGTRTGVHYNLQVGGETALMVKERFIELYGEPLYTVGLGASGGAIQQYVYAQNHPGLIDAGVATQSYPDMVTQIIHVGDCELLEHYMDVTDRDNDKWTITKNRSWLVGLNAEDGIPDPLAEAKVGLGFATAPGSTECIESWRGLTALAMNPHYGIAPGQQHMVPPEIMAEVHWTHFDDLRNIYGVDEHGYARSLFDNVGVQYGLQALLEGNITPEEFLDLNTKVGGWKHPKDMVQEGFPFLGSAEDVMADPSLFDPWSSRNMTLSASPDAPAPRTQGDLKAMQAAYESGMVFDGQLDIPIIDWRPYLEHELDMHNVHQSFAVRQRIIERMGHADHQLIWFTDARPEQEVEHVLPALAVLDEWLTKLRQNPKAGLAAARPESAVDRCFTTSGEEIAAGGDVWNGILDDQAPGACTQQFPLYSTSRIVAGGPLKGGIFKCQLKPVETALSDGTYGSWVPSDEQATRLKTIFPDGVCDYSKPDAGRPSRTSDLL